MNSLSMGAAACWAAAAAAGADYYVSPAGRDTNPGTRSRPLATLQAAVNRLKPGDTCWAREGAYRETVVFPRSGEAGRPITLKACDGERVVVSGCDPVAGWTPVSNGIWRAAMPWTLGAGRNQVFCGGRVLREARHPNAAAPGLEQPVNDLSPLWPSYGAFSIPQETRVSQPGRVVSRLLEGQPEGYWAGALYCGVHFEGWCAQTGVIEASKPGEIQVGDRTQGWWFGDAYGGKYPQAHEEGRGMIVGHLHALDAPGEWHWQDGALFLIPPAGGRPQAVVAKRRQLALDLSGRSHIRVEGVDVTGASLRLEESERCVLERCNLSYITHYTLHTGIGQIERGRDTVRSGETGVYVSGRDNAFLSCSVRVSAGAGFHIRGYHQTIHNCLIDEVSYVGHYLNAITDAVSDFGAYEGLLVGGHAITFNTMRNAGRHFFNFSGNGTSLASRTRGPMDYAATLFAHNHLYNGMLLTRDAGFLTGYFGSGGSLNGQHAQVAYNVMHDCYDLAAMRWNKLGLIYLDQGTCGVDVHHNLLWAAPGSLQRDLWFNTCCVGVREYANRFHGLFTRSCAELRDEDFPEGRAFRFGHDFAAPPDRPAWPRLERADAAPAAARELRDGDALELACAARSNGWQTAVLRFASGARGLNADRSARASPRHRQASDPLVLEAKDNSGADDRLRMQWTFFHDIPDGGWIRFDRVPFGDGYRRLRAVYGKDSDEPWRLDVRLDAVDGPLVGRAELGRTDRPRSGHVQLYAEATAALSSEAAGTRDVYVIFRSPGGAPCVDFEYLRFEQARGEVPLRPGEARLELRSGGRDGALLGAFFPRFTGGTNAFCEFVAPLGEGASGGPLWLVARSALEGTCGVFGGLRLEAGAAGELCAGLGEPPRRVGRVWGGAPVWPEVTHRPRPAPAAAALAEASRADRPLTRAETFSAPPVLDGALLEWTWRPLELRAGPEGAAAEGPAPRAWFGCDGQAFYVAVRAPAGGGARPPSGARAWGAWDGAELALRRADGAQPGPTLCLRGWRDGRLDVADLGGAPEPLRRRLAERAAFRAAERPGGWSGEWRVPLEAFGGARPRLVDVNVTVRHAAAGRWQGWRQAGGASYDLSNGGTVVLGDAEALLTPALKASLAVWLDAADAESVDVDEGGAARAWRDRSGRGRDAVQLDAGRRPVYLAPGPDGRRALSFDEGRKTRLELQDLSDAPMDVAVFAVAANPQPGRPENHNPRILTASDGSRYDYQCGISCNIPGTETGEARLFAFAGAARWAKQVRVGCFSPRDQTFLSGRVSEILVFGRALTPEEGLLVKAYLTAKWGL